MPDGSFQGSGSNTATETRRTKLKELIRSQGFVSIPDLREAIEASESTIRRDLDFLEEQGEAKRTHGGVFCTGPSAGLQVFEDRRVGHWEKKRQIALAAATMIEDRETILLDGGSTTYELARQLIGRPLQIVTNSLPVANLFATSERTDLVFLGGAVHHRTGITLGPYANQMMEGITVQKAILSVAGIDERGYYNSNLLLVETERAMMRCADQTIVVADSSKFGRSSLSRLCSLSEVQKIVVDNELDQVWRNRLSENGVETMIASSTESSHVDTAKPSIPTPHLELAPQKRKKKKPIV
ncbi:MAG: DeoR/GlpR family DNA-binding transcription regulator [Pirellulaceae bacterium]|nr:DeoR/GlpR family DNA-binding transcription regulator [Pirellulaceae bacterium]